MFTPIPAETGIQIQTFGNTVFDGMIDRYYQIRELARQKVILTASVLSWRKNV